jgi:hypothetical protein
MRRIGAEDQAGRDIAADRAAIVEHAGPHASDEGGA